MKNSILLIALVALCCSSSFGATLTFTTQASWLAALSGGQAVLGTETFESGGLQSFTNIVNTIGTSAIGPARGDNLSGSVWQGMPTINTETFSFIGAGVLFAVGGFWDTSPNGEGNGLDLTVNLVGGGTDSAGHIGPIGGTFYGLISTVPITGLTVANGGTGPTAGENYDVDNLSFAGTAPTTGVPEPTTFAFGLAGLGAWALLRRSRARSEARAGR